MSDEVERKVCILQGENQGWLPVERREGEGTQ